MKRILITILGLSFAFASCEKSSDEPMVEWTFEAPQTKASLSGSGAFSWAPGDEIAVWNGTASAFVTFATQTGSGRFTAQAPANAHFTAAAYYPASIATGTEAVSLPTSYTLAELSGGKGMPMFAAVENGNNILNFKHLGALLKVKVLNVPAGNVQIVLSSSSVSLSGGFTVTPSGGDRVISAQTGSATVALSLSLSDTQDVEFTVPVPVGTYALTCTVPERSPFLTDPVTFQRGHLYTLSTIDVENGGEFAQTCEVYELVDDNNNWE